MLLENNPYGRDTRVQNVAKSLIQEGYRVSVICPTDRKGTNDPFQSNLRIYSTLTPPHLPGKIGYMWEYGSYFIFAAIITLYLGIKSGFDVIHLNNPPDFLILIALPWKLLGKKIVFDHHDLAPEIFAYRYQQSSGKLYDSLVFAEKLSCRYANVILATNNSVKEMEISRSDADPSKIFVVRNGPKLSDFPATACSSTDQTEHRNLICYLGTIGPMDGVEYLVNALIHIVCEQGRGDVNCRLIGSGESVPLLQDIVESLGIGKHFEFTGWVHDRRRLVELVTEATLCVDPAPSNSLNDRSTMIKIMEYMALGKPIVAFNLPETVESAQGAALYAKSNNEIDLADKIIHLIENPKLMIEMGAKGRTRVESHLAWRYSVPTLMDAYNVLKEQKAGLN